MSKLFVKKGTLDTAVDDFYSLDPTSIMKEDDSMFGFVGNQVIKLQWATERYDTTLNIIGAESGNRVVRTIVYTDIPIHAKDLYKYYVGKN